jgi:hypothetical protein
VITYPWARRMAHVSSTSGSAPFRSQRGADR